MNNLSNEEKLGLSDFGKQFLERNSTFGKINNLNKLSIGINVDEPYHEFFGELSRDITILEIGCNIGVKLEILKKMGFKNLTGIDINPNAIKEAKKKNPHIKFIESSINELSIDSKYDLVFTSVVLIHQNLEILNLIIEKIIKISRKYIFGYEYFSEKLEEIEINCGNKIFQNYLWRLDHN